MKNRGYISSSRTFPCMGVPQDLVTVKILSQETGMDLRLCTATSCQMKLSPPLPKPSHVTVTPRDIRELPHKGFSHSSFLLSLPPSASAGSFGPWTASHAQPSSAVLSHPVWPQSLMTHASQHSAETVTRTPWLAGPMSLQRHFSEHI